MPHANKREVARLGADKAPFSSLERKASRGFFARRGQELGVAREKGRKWHRTGPAKGQLREAPRRQQAQQVQQAAQIREVVAKVDEEGERKLIIAQKR